MNVKSNGGSEKMSAPEDIKSKGIKEVPMNEAEIMKEACNLYDGGVEGEKSTAKIQGREIINHLRPKIPFLMEKLGFSIENYKVTEEIKFVPWGKKYHIRSPGHCSAKLYVTTGRMKFLFEEYIHYDYANRPDKPKYYLVLFGLKCYMCDMWVTMPYVNEEDEEHYTDYHFGYAIRNRNELGEILHTYSKLRCPECHELLLSYGKRWLGRSEW